MTSFLEQCIEKYESLPGSMTLVKAWTPYLADIADKGTFRRGIETREGESTPDHCEYCGYVPGWQQLPEKEELPVGLMADHAASVLMKCMYAARMARYDLLRPVQGLAKFITKWTIRHDEELWRMMSYIKTTKDRKMAGWVGDDFRELRAHLYSDADFAGCKSTSLSTSGSHLCIKGPKSSFPICAQSKRQGCVSQSTTEAELVAASHAIRTTGIPILSLLEVWRLDKGATPSQGWAIEEELRLLGDSGKEEKPWRDESEEETLLLVHLDNRAMIEVIRTGRNPTMRHIGRVHGVSISFLHQVYRRIDVSINYISSTLMAADIYTKTFPEEPNGSTCANKSMLWTEKI